MKVEFAGEKTIEITNTDIGKSLLEISLSHDIPIMHACGGNARCSTCRVIMLEGHENTSARTLEEDKLARAKGFESEIRLACQLKVQGSMKVRRLVLDETDYAEIVSHQGSFSTGREESLAILFSDIRGFTSFSESQLAYDVVHILNRYFHHMGEVVLKHGGKIDKYIGDGLMAIFGLRQNNARETCLSAVHSALMMQQELIGINRYLSRLSGTQFQIGIGIHYGNVIVGDVGHPSNAQFTVIGDNVNFASRIEATTKKAGADILISEQVFAHIRDTLEPARRFRAPIKGKSGTYRLFEVTNMKPANKEAPLLERVPMVLRSKREIAEQTWAFTLEPFQPFSFVAGQFFDVQLVELGADQIRSFSLASVPGEKMIEIAMRMRPSAFKKYLNALKIGSTIIASQAKGVNLNLSETAKLHILIAGGIGITPFLSILRTHLDSGKTFFLFHFNRTQAPFSVELSVLALESKNFVYVPVSTSESNTDTKENGRLSLALIEKYVPSLLNAAFYISGPPAMVNDCKDTLLAAGISEKSIQTEDFFGY